MRLPFLRVDDFGGKSFRMPRMYPQMLSCPIPHLSRCRPQNRFDAMDGVVRSVVGYSGGKGKDPTYRNILDYTEALLIEYDPKIVSYEDLVLSWTQMHFPNYHGKTQYRSAVWYMT